MARSIKSISKAYTLMAFVLHFLLAAAAYAGPENSCNIDVDSPQVVRVGFVTDGSTPYDKEILSFYKKQIKESMRPYYKVVYSKRWLLSAHESKEGARKALLRLLSPSGPDAIYALGVISSIQVIGLDHLSKPVIAPWFSRLAFSPKDIRPGVRNRFIYIDSLYYLDRDLDTFRKVVPFKRCVLVLDEREAASLDGLDEKLHEFGRRHGLEIHLVRASSSAQNTLARIPEGTDAAFVGALWHMDEEEQRRFAKGLLDRKIAGFALWSEKQVEQGLLAGLEPRDKDNVLARRSAVALLDLLHGSKGRGKIKQFSRQRQLVINMASARSLGMYPNLLLLTKAKVLNEKEEAGRRINILKAVEEAVSANLRLQSERVNVKAGEHAVREKMAELLPRIDVGTGYRAIDQDRSKSSSGVTPERAWTGTASGSILLYSEKKWAKYTAEEHLQRARQMRKEQVKLDVTYDASVAYLNVLRARTVEKIYKENLKLTKANLERARIKVATGAVGPDEAYRWESKFANDARAVLYKESETMDAMEALNRILHRPLQEPFVPEEASLSDPLFIMGDRFYLGLMENPILVRKFKVFAAKEALANRPELKGFDEAIKAKARLAAGAKRELWLPDFTVEWKVDQYFAEDGHGRREGTMFDDTDWNVGVFARIPLFEGGKTAAKAGRLEQEVSRLEIDRGAAAEVIVQRVLSAINRTRASYPSISLTKEAALAAKKNLDLVTDSYIHGIKTIIDLLDAQSQYLNARLEAANAVYNFLIDFMGVQRAMGKFVTFMPENERQEWIKRAKESIGIK